MSIYLPSLLDKFKDFVNGLKANWEEYEAHVADFETHQADYETHKADYETHKADDVSNGVHGMGSIAGQDYEEGTWTPRITGNNAYSVQTGSYIRLGNIIQIEGRIVLSSLDDSISSANLSIEGLPFVGKNEFGGVSVGYTSRTNIPTDRIGIRGFVTGNAILLYAPTINTSWRLLGEHLTNTSEIRFTATYQI